jgi:hypothetical protein
MVRFSEALRSGKSIDSGGGFTAGTAGDSRSGDRGYEVRHNNPQRGAHARLICSGLPCFGNDRGYYIFTGLLN